jgi:hypothetical protein
MFGGLSAVPISNNRMETQIASRVLLERDAVAKWPGEERGNERRQVKRM